MTTENANANPGANSTNGAGAGAAANSGAPAANANAAPAAGTATAAPAGNANANADERYGAPTGEYVVPKDAEAFDPALKTTITAYAREHNLSQKATEKLFASASAYSTSQEKALAASHAANLTDWKAKASADKEFGGETYEANRAVMAKGLETFATPELRSILTESGLENHPEFARFFYRVGKAVSEDKFVRGGAGNSPSNTGVFSYDKSDHKV